MGFKQYEVHTPEQKQRLNKLYGLIISYENICKSFGSNPANHDILMVRIAKNEISYWRDLAIARRDPEEIACMDEMLEACRIKLKIIETIKEINHEGQAGQVLGL